ncbi:uncharacterized protein LOC110349760 [Heterocephalus glaber]|uniref:Uncharacterized protein LOC110349760 n=1 Tax=Heterocephalus glaber TaxID=10181 RepID=A0AAX6T2Q0_HETGA|nr:uncharacterized protein LOC110349760 [Heterocephalus glaber]
MAPLVQGAVSSQSTFQRKQPSPRPSGTKFWIACPFTYKTFLGPPYHHLYFSFSRPPDFPGEQSTQTAASPRLLNTLQSVFTAFYNFLLQNFNTLLSGPGTPSHPTPPLLRSQWPGTSALCPGLLHSHKLHRECPQGSLSKVSAFLSLELIAFPGFTCPWGPKIPQDSHCQPGISLFLTGLKQKPYFISLSISVSSPPAPFQSIPTLQDIQDSKFLSLLSPPSTHTCSFIGFKTGMPPPNPPHCLLSCTISSFLSVLTLFLFFIPVDTIQAFSPPQ